MPRRHGRCHMVPTICFLRVPGPSSPTVSAMWHRLDKARTRRVGGRKASSGLQVNDAANDFALRLVSMGKLLPCNVASKWEAWVGTMGGKPRKNVQIITNFSSCASAVLVNEEATTKTVGSRNGVPAFVSGRLSQASMVPFLCSYYAHLVRSLSSFHGRISTR